MFQMTFKEQERHVDVHSGGGLGTQTCLHLAQLSGVNEQLQRCSNWSGLGE